MPTKDQQATITETYGSEIADQSRLEVERSDKSREHAKADAKRRERGGGHSCLAFARAGLGYLYDESESMGYNVRYAEKRVKWERRKEKVEVESYRRKTTRCRMRKRVR